jgi:hypothetical protein
VRRAKLVPAIAALAASAVMSACVDHKANAISFCRQVDEVVDRERDGEELSRAEVRAIADDVAVAMRDAEDATRKVRTAARDMSVAYDELASLLGDEDATGEEITELHNELETAREDVRRSCTATE